METKKERERDRGSQVVAFVSGIESKKAQC